MNIGFVVPGSLDTVSGGYYYDRRLITSLREMGHEVQIIALPWTTYGRQLAANLHFRLPGRGPAAGKHSLGTQNGVALDIIIEDELAHAAFISANKITPRPPVVGLVHHLRSSEPDTGLAKTLYATTERAFLLTCDAFILNSVTTRKSVLTLAGGDKPHLVAPPPCDRFAPPLPEAAIEARAAGQGPLRIVFLGNVVRRKGLHTLLLALSVLDSATWTLDIAGSLDLESGYAASMIRLASKRMATASIRFHGSLLDGRLAELLSTSDVLVLPSAYEGFGLAFLEGMGFGLPAVAASAGAAPENITDGVNGLLVPPGDAAGLSAQLRRLVADRNLLRQLSLGARQHFLRQKPWADTANSVAAFLERIAATASV